MITMSDTVDSDAEEVMATITELCSVIVGREAADALEPGTRIGSDGPLGHLGSVVLRRLLGTIRPDLDPDSIDGAESIERWIYLLLGATPSESTQKVGDMRLRARLRPLVPSDYELLRLSLAGPDEHNVFGGETPDHERFPGVIWSGVATQFVVVAESDPTSRPLGLIQVREENPTDGTCAIFAHRVGGRVEADRAAVTDGIVVCVRHILAHARMRKIYFRIPESSIGVFRPSLGSLLALEGTLTDHVVISGCTVDQHVVALWTHRFEDLMSQTREALSYLRESVSKPADPRESQGSPTRTAGQRR